MKVRPEVAFRWLVALLWVCGLVLIAADSFAHVTVSRLFVEYWPLRTVTALVAIVVLGFFVLAVALAVVRSYLGEGDWRKGLKRFAVSALAAWFLTTAARHFAFWLWEAGPYGSQYEAVAQRYTDLCTSQQQVDYQQWETDVDWHAGDNICAPLERRLQRLYPGPAWLFGNRLEP